MLEVKLDHNQHAPEATTGSHSPEKQISNFDPTQWVTIASNESQKYTVQNLLNENPSSNIAKWYQENVELGHHSLEQEITPKQATIEFSKFKKDEIVPDHELGHFEAAKSYGYQAEATVIPGSGYRGLTRYWGFSGEDIRTRLWRGIVISVAGEAGAGCSDGCGSDFAKAHHFAHILAKYFNEGTVGSIISSAKSEARSRISRGSQRFKAIARKLYFNKFI